LSGDRQVLVPDLRNHGDSPWDPRMDYPSMAGDLAALLRSNGIGRAHLVGHSMGGKVAMWLALRDPGLVASLLVEDIAPVTYPNRFATLIRALCDLPLDRIRDRRDAEARLGELIPGAALRGYLLTNLIPGEHGWRWRINLPVLADSMAQIVGFPDAAGRQFPGPTLFLYGGRSDYMTGEALAAIRRLFPLARLRAIPGAGHWIHSQRPDDFLDAMRGFLRSGNGG
jgi:esterase